jgi:hypothetical protein
MNWYQTLKTKPEFHAKGRINDMALLYPPFRKHVETLVQKIEAEHLPFRVFETFRSATRQAEVYGQGHSKMIQVGPHNFGLAVDIVAYVDGKWTWVTKGINWKRLGELGESLGLTWGGRWKHPYDPAHFQHIKVDNRLYNSIRNGKWYPSL